MIKFLPNEKTLSSTSRLINCVIQNITEGDDLIIKLWHIRKMDAADGCVENGMMLSILWSLSWDLWDRNNNVKILYYRYLLGTICLRLKWKFNISIHPPSTTKINIMQFQSIFLFLLLLRFRGNSNRQKE